MAALVLRDIHVRFGTRDVLRGAQLAVRPGEVVGLTGANGSGKSTLLRVAAGLLRPAPLAGARAEIFAAPPERARRAGWIGWSSAAGPASFARRLSLRQNLVHAGRLAGLSRRACGARVDALAERLGFRDHLDAPAEQCSTGVRQRAVLARALVHGPRLLLLDEPLRGVDAASSSALAAALASGWRDEAVIWVSHSRDELGLVADRVAHLRDGRVWPRRERAAA